MTMELIVYHNRALARPLSKLARELGYKRTTKDFDTYRVSRLRHADANWNYREVFDLLGALPHDAAYYGRIWCVERSHAIRFACRNDEWRQIDCLLTGMLYLIVGDDGLLDAEELDDSRAYLDFERKVVRAVERVAEGLPPLENDWPDDVLTPVDLDDGPEEDC